VRSNLVYSAENRVNHPFLLISLIIKEARKMHTESTRTEDTVNRAFALVAKCRVAEAPTAPSLGETPCALTPGDLLAHGSDIQTGSRVETDAGAAP
jgi:hypothetical protein